MLTHAKIWSAIDRLAENNRLSTSGLARNAGLDPTSFNPSKRFTTSGRERWPSTESIAKILRATHTGVNEFFELMGSDIEQVSETLRYRQTASRPGVPVIGFAQAGGGGFFDDGGFPVGGGWEEVPLPMGASENCYALKVSGNSMEPLYREGDVVIVDPHANVRRGDRVIAKTREGEVLAKTLERRTSREIELKSLNPEHEDRVISMGELEWMARIIWASQ